MSNPASLTLIAPELRIADELITYESSQWPQLSRLAGRGRLCSLGDSGDPRIDALRPWQAALLQALGVERFRDKLPSAALSRSAAATRPVPGYWMHADLVHLAAGMDHLSFVRLRAQAQVQPQERSELRAAVLEHLRAVDFEMCELPDGRWLIGTQRPLQVATTTPDAAAAQPLDRVMPQGRDAGCMRRLMTELQMVLHDHPVNERRARADLPAINAIWLWGVGEMTRLPPMPITAASGDEPYLRGICQLLSQRCEPAPSDADALLSSAAAHTKEVAVIEVSNVDALEKDWLVPLAAALGRGKLAQLNLVLSEWSLSVSRTELLKLWRRACPPASWAAI